MANKESTAVNELIDFMQSGKPLHDGSNDLMFSPPKPRNNPPRMTATIPSLRGAGGDVPPLPPTRVPSGTAQLSVGTARPQIRSSTAPPTRNTTIPPLPQSSTLLPQAKASALPPPRPSRPALPPPIRTLPPQLSPVAAPFESKRADKEAHPFAAVPVATRPPIDAPGDVVHADHWFEASRAMDLVDDLQLGTQTVQRVRDPRRVAKKLVLPMAGLLVAGVCVGGFFAFNGEGGKKHHAVTTKVASAPAVAPANIATVPPKAAIPTPAFAAPTPAPVAVAPPSAVQAPAAPVAVAPASAVPAPTAPVAVASAPNEETPPASKTERAAVVSAAPDIAKPAEARAPDIAKPVAAIATKTESVTEPIKAPPVQAVVAAPTPAAPAIRASGKLVDVRIDSKPEGATVMLVDNGKTSFLGTTPLSASVDPSRAYDVILTLEGRPTQMSHLDPAKTPRVEIALGKTPPQAVQQTKAPVAVEAPAPAPAPAPTAPTKHHRHQAAAKVVATGGIAEPSFDAAEPKAETKVGKQKPQPKAAGGSGVLMVSSKPPCQIFVDGHDTGLSTPQRSLSLPAGTHKITLVNKQESVMKTVSVAITADQSTKLIQDLMKK